MEGNNINPSEEELKELEQKQREAMMFAANPQAAMEANGGQMPGMGAGIGMMGFQMANQMSTPEAAPVEPVAPVAPVEPVAPVAPEVQTAPVQPVQGPVETAPVEPTAPVAPVAPAPVQPAFDNPAQAVAQPIEQPSAPVQPVAAPQAPLQQPEPPKKNGAFTAIVIILIVAIIGVGGGVAFKMSTDKKGNSSNTTTTGEVKGAEEGTTTTTSKYAITTNPNTTTIARTTRPADTPVPTSTGSTSFEIAGNKINVPSGYEYYGSEYNVIANKEKKISMAFQYIKGHTTTELMNRVFELIGEYQENGYVVLDYDAYSVNGRPYLALQVQTENNNLGDLEVYCDLGSGVLQTGILADKSNTIRDLIQTVDNMISSSISSFAVTDDSQVSDTVNYNLIDATDERLFAE